MSVHPAETLPLTNTASTRLLSLFPGQEDEPIRASLLVVDLEDPERPQYEAISYTWGNDQAESQIDVNGQSITIRVNLYQCLSRLRPTTGNLPRLLWNDFLCISQNDLDEKAQQIRMLGRIFRSAEQVLVWVGEHNYGSEQLFRPWPEQEEAKEQGLIHRMDRLLRKSPLSRAESARRANVWMAFVGRLYWGRTWIVQEIYQARKIIVHCGPDHMPWEELISNRIQGDNHFDDISLKAPLNVVEGFGLSLIVDKVRELNRLRQYDDSFASQSVLHFMQHFKDSWSTMPSDKVFAFLSMDQDTEHTRNIPVDYDMHLAELLIRVYAARCVSGNEGLGAGLEWQRQLPKPEPVVASLRLDQAQRMELLRLVADRITQTDAVEKQRWQHIYSQMEFAVDILWRRDRQKGKSLPNDQSNNLEWSGTTTSANESESRPHQEAGEEDGRNNEAAELLATSGATRPVRLRFKSGQDVYLKLPTPWSRKSQK